MCRLRGHRGLRLAYCLFVALAILLLVGPSRVKQYAYSDRPMLDGRQTNNTRLQEGPWHLFLIYDLCGEATGQGWINHHHNPYALYSALDPAAPRYEYWGPIPRYGWVSYSPWPSYRVVKEWDWAPLRQWSDLRRACMIVFIPLFNWICCLLLLHLLTWAAARGDSGTAFDAMDRRAALTGIGQAAFVPIRVAWIGVMLLVIPLLAEPGLTLRFRVIAYWTLLAIGVVGPCLVALRCLFADRSFCLRWGRIVPGFLILAFGCLVPGWLVRWGIYWGTFQLLLVGEYFMDLKSAGSQ